VRPPWFIIGRTARPSCRVAPVTSTLGLGMQTDRQACIGATARQPSSLTAAQPNAEPARIKVKFESGFAGPESFGFQAQPETPSAPGGHMRELRYLLGSARRSAAQPTKALRASVLRRAVSLARPLGGSTAAASPNTAGTSEAPPSCACAATFVSAVYRVSATAMRCPCSCGCWAQDPRPNMSVNRRRHGRPARPGDRDI
jgi:hypothetical protein